ncbi:MAG: SRPBCC family protein [Spirochaetia bacterium]|nr:SRPBCC family protein [Spirochaetia bacterium]
MRSRLSLLRAKKSVNTLDASARELGTTRIFKAPRELVFKVWTDPDHVGLWWGPNGFTNTIHKMDVRVGGVFTFTMHAPNGVDYPNKIIFREVVRPERLVYDHGDPNQDEKDFFHVVVTFTAKGPKETELTMKSVFPTAEMLAEVVEKHGAREGMYQHLDRLEAYLVKVGNQYGV